MPYRMLARSLLIAALLAVLCLGFGAAGPRHAAAASAYPIQGDVNCSGAADATDSLQILVSVANSASNVAGCVDAAGADIEGPLQGDVTCDEAVDVTDGLDVLRGVALLETTNSYCLSDAGDVDCDNRIDGADALSIFRFAAGIAPASPAGAPGCSLTGATLVHPPTSEDLIAAALAGGNITYEESLLYRAYALYDLPGLPEEFRSATIDYHAALGLFTEVLQNESTLSPGLLEQLAPLRARPADPISIFNNPPGTVSVAAPAEWHSLLAGNGKARVWVQDGPGWDYDLSADAAEVTRVWTPLGSIFRYAIPDTPGAANVNPDSAIDIYFVNVGTVDLRKAGCTAVPRPPNCALTWAGAYTGYAAPFTARTSSSYVMVATGQSGPRLTYVLAHELMHAGQSAYDYNEPLWIKDATATWGGFRVLQELGVTRAELYGMAERFYTELNQPLTRDTGYLDETRYRRWLYFFFASMDAGDQIVTQMWQAAAAGGVQNEKAVDTAFSFDDHFPQFTVRNWNQDPVDPLYSDPSGDPDFPGNLKPPIPASRDKLLDGTTSVTLETALAPLAALYYRYTFGATVRNVDFYPLLNANPHAHIWALVKANGNWKKPEDWSTDGHSFCRDIPDENVSEVIIILSNSGMNDDLPGGPKLHIDVSETGCDGYVGWAQTTLHIKDDSQDMTYTTQQVPLRFKVLATGPGYVDYTLINPSGPVGWDAHGTIGDCTADGAASVTFPGIPFDPATLTPGGYLHVVGAGGGDWHGGLIEADDPSQTFTVTCPGDPPFVYQESFAPAADLWLIQSEPNTHDGDKTILKGHQVFVPPCPPPAPSCPPPTRTQTFDWELKPVGPVPPP